MKNAWRSSDLKINENFASRLQKVFHESFLNLIYRSEAFPKASYYYAYVSHCQEKKKRKRKRQAVRSLKDVYLAILLFNIFHLSRLVLIYGSLITLSSACVYVYVRTFASLDCKFRTDTITTVSKLNAMAQSIVIRDDIRRPIISFYEHTGMHTRFLQLSS